jgi:predicted transposase/invertase (TIGR01784 family)
LENRPPEVQGKIFEKLFRAAEIEQLTTEDMEEYKKSILEYRDVRDAVEYAREEGFEKGIEKGLIEGSNQKSIEIIKKCLEKHMPLEEIADLTGFSKEQIIAIINDER